MQYHFSTNQNRSLRCRVFGAALFLLLLLASNAAHAQSLPRLVLVIPPHDYSEHAADFVRELGGYQLEIRTDSNPPSLEEDRAELRARIVLSGNASNEVDIVAQSRDRETRAHFPYPYDLENSRALAVVLRAMVDDLTHPIAMGPIETPILQVREPSQPVPQLVRPFEDDHVVPNDGRRPQFAFAAGLRSPGFSASNGRDNTFMMPGPLDALHLTAHARLSSSDGHGISLRFSWQHQGYSYADVSINYSFLFEANRQQKLFFSLATDLGVGVVGWEGDDAVSTQSFFGPMFQLSIGGYLNIESIVFVGLEMNSHAAISLSETFDAPFASNDLAITGSLVGGLRFQL